MFSAFITLPDELKIRILLNLDFQSLLQCASACHSFRRMLQNTSALQTLVQLGLHGMVDAGSDLSHPELLARVTGRQKAWEDLSWRKVTTLSKLNEPLWSTCELVGGVLVSDRSTNELSFLRLPDDHDYEANSKEIELTMARRVFHDITIRNFTIDPSQDLIAILEDVDDPWNIAPGQTIQIHLRTISNNAAHPQAQMPALRFTALPISDNVTMIYNTLVQIVDDVVALFFCRGENSHCPRVVMWNWVRGFTIYDSATSDFDLPLSAHHFTLLTRATFIVTSTQNEGSLQLFSFSPTTNSDTPHLTASFLLPDIIPQYRVNELDIHGSPAEGRLSPGDMFYPGREDGLLAVTVRYQCASSRATEVFSIYVHVRTLLRHALKLRGAIHWDIWGPANTRFLPSRTPRNWTRYVHGQRVVRGIENGELRIIDLAPIHRLREHACELSPHYKNCMHTKATNIELDVFVKTVSTCLPMRISRRLMPALEYCDLWMIDDKRIVGLKMDGEDVLKTLHIYSF